MYYESTYKAEFESQWDQVMRMVGDDEVAAAIVGKQRLVSCMKFMGEKFNAEPAEVQEAVREAVLTRKEVKVREYEIKTGRVEALSPAEYARYFKCLPFQKMY
jgi:hypothetical protein